MEQTTVVGGRTRVDTPVSWGGLRGLCVQVLLVCKKEVGGEAGCPRGPGWEAGGNGELLFNRYRVSKWVDENVLEMDGGDGCTTR